MIIQVKIKVNKDSLYIENNTNINIKVNDYVIVKHGAFEYIGIVKNIFESFDNKSDASIIRIANKKDIKNNLNNIKESKKAYMKCEELIKKLKLNMRLLNAFYSFDKKQLLFQYTSDDRVDFRELTKQLASIYKVRIEMRQIGIRDKAAQISGLGLCGMQLCCARFLKNIGSISINCAKNQNLALNPNKINGVCGRLLCCLKYEENVYEENIKKLPKIGSTIETKQGNAKVISRDILNMTIKVKYDNDDILEIKVDN